MACYGENMNQPSARPIFLCASMKVFFVSINNLIWHFSLLEFHGVICNCIADFDFYKFTTPFLFFFPYPSIILFCLWSLILCLVCHNFALFIFFFLRSETRLSFNRFHNMFSLLFVVYFLFYKFWYHFIVAYIIKLRYWKIPVYYLNI